MKIAIIGPRHLIDEAIVRAFVRTLQSTDTVISGGAIGVDTWAVDEAKKLSVSYLVIVPDYTRYPAKVAPLVRNCEIVDKSDRVVAFWNGLRSGPNKSTGTIHAVKYAKKKGKPFEVRRGSIVSSMMFWPEESWQ